jgi:hypothetical protein
MTNKKISALASATTPLAGTEVLPIVQSSATTQVSVANLTAGRSVSVADLTVSTGNITPSTAAKGINFTANTGAAGMTSRLLNWYEEGTWTPTFTGWAIAPTLFYAQYTRIGRQVTVNIYAQGGTSSYTAIGGLPFTANAAQGSAGVINSSNAAVLYGCSIVPSGSTIQGINMVMGANYWQLTITYFV